MFSWKFMEYYSNKGNWKKILLEIYRFAPGSWGDSISMNRYDDRHPLAKKLDLRGHELGDSIVFLEEQKLITPNVSSKVNHVIQWFLTEKGFNVALELEKQLREIKVENRNEKLQLFTLYLTIILVSTSMVNFAKDIFPSMKEILFWGYLILMGILVLSIPSKFRKR